MSFNRPAANQLILVVISFAAGIAIATFNQASELFCLVSLFCLSASILIAYRFASPTPAFALLLIFFFLLGTVYVRPSLAPPQKPFHICNQIIKNQEASLIGVLAKVPKTQGYRTQLIMDVEQLLTADGGEFVPSTGRVRLSMNGRPPADLEPGQRFMARAKLSHPRNFNTPGTFDFRQHLARQSIWITGWMRSPAEIIKIMETRDPPLWEKLKYMPEIFRYRVSRFLNKLPMNWQNKALYKALLIGDKSELSAETLENFKKTGSYHLLAISGMHIGLLAFLITAAFGVLLKRSPWLLLHLNVKKIALSATLVPLICYALITGMQPPVVRALIMTIVFIAAIFLNRQWSIPTNIAIAALLILLWNPASLYSISFQLSFAAVSAIAFFFPRIKPYLLTSSPAPHFSRLDIRLKRWVLASLAISIAAMIGTAPLLLYYFNRISLVSPISTLLVAPLLCLWTLPCGLIALLLMPLSPELAQQVLQAGAAGLTATMIFIEFLSRWDYIDLWLPKPSITEIICYSVLIASTFYWRRHRIAVSLTVIAAFLLVALPVSTSIQKRLSSETTVTVLDVGSGSSTLLELPNGYTILIDGGGPRSDRFNVGEWIIAPFLWQKKISTLDALIITQPDAKHYNGLSFILKRFKPRTVWVTTTPNPEAGYKKLLNETEELGITISALPESEGIIFRDGDTCLTSIGSSFQADALYGGKGVTAGEGHDANPQIGALRLACGQRSFLFAEDIRNFSTSADVAGDEQQIHVDVLLALQKEKNVTNHDAILEDLLNVTDPDYAVFYTASLMPRNVFGLNKEDGGKAEPIIFSAVDHGTISFTTDGRNLTARTFKFDQTNK